MQQAGAYSDTIIAVLDPDILRCYDAVTVAHEFSSCAYRESVSGWKAPLIAHVQEHGLSCGVFLIQAQIPQQTHKFCEVLEYSAKQGVRPKISYLIFQEAFNPASPHLAEQVAKGDARAVQARNQWMDKDPFHIESSEEWYRCELHTFVMVNFGVPSRQFLRALGSHSHSAMLAAPMTRLAINLRRQTLDLLVQTQIKSTESSYKLHHEAEDHSTRHPRRTPPGDAPACDDVN